MKISIIIPFHRGIHFLEDCLESIRDQGIVDYEILLILDHVKEEIQPCIDQFTDLPIRTVDIVGSSTIERKFRKPNTEELFKDCSGVAHARNIGIEEARGKYIYFLDSDDYILEGTLPLLLKEAEERQAEFTYGKRVGTWFRRKAYLSSLLLEDEKEEKDEDEEEEKEDQDLDSDEEDISSEEDENSLEEDSDPERDSSTEHSTDDSSNVEDDIDSDGDSSRDVDSQNYRGFEHQEALDDEIQIEEEGDLSDFTPMKRTRREKRIYKVERKLMRYQEGTKIELTHIAEAYYTLLVVKKGIKNLSVLGILFQKEFIDRNKLRFNEAYMFFADAPFVIQALKEVKTCAYVGEGVYVKRKHNDPIHYPALSQVKVDDRFDEFIQAYKEGRLNTFSDSALRTYIENKFIAYFVGTYAPLLRRGKSDLWRNEHLEIMRSCMREVDEERIRRLRGYKKRVVKALIDGKDKKLVGAVNLHLAKKKLKKIYKNRRLFGYYLYHHYFVKMEVKENWVLCESFLGKNYSDSPKYIYEYLSTKYPGKYRFIWIINKKGTKIPYKHTKVKRFSIRYCYYLARCKYDVFNMRQPDWMRKRDENIFLETWHGTPLKKLVFDQEEVMGATPLYKAQVYRQSRQWDYLVSANHFSTKVFKSAFLFDKEILEYGYPRNDILHHPEKDRIGAEIRKKLGIPINKKTILYAPTWRDDEYYGRGEYKFALKLDLHYMRRIIGEEYVILLRTHYFIADALDTTGLEGFAWNVSKYDDISELYLISDLLITDYSSVFFDYANLKRPILFYTYDLDKYRDMLRGFYMDIEKDVPGPLLFTTEEVTEAIENIDEIIERYSNKYKVFYEKFCSLEDGHASENIAKSVFDLK